MHKKGHKVLKILFLVVFMMVVFAICFWFFAPSSAKKALIKALSKSEIIRDIVADQVEEDFQNNVQDTDFKPEEIIVPEEVEKKLTGYKNVVLFGIDARGKEFDSDTRSDTMMIISINNDSGAVRMVSIFRDTYLNIIKPNGETFYSKVNSAYSVGGPQGAISTLNTNLDLNIDDYIVVNFDGLAETINLMGGVDINVSEYEKQRINEIGSDMEAEFGITFNPVEDFGLVHLDGYQATAYCRIRDAVFTDADGNEYHYDFGRTARQRYVMQELVTKAKGSGISSLLSLAKQVLNMNTEEKTFIKTSLGYDEIMDLIPVVIDYNIEANSGFPFTLQTPNINGADLVVAEGLACNVTALHEFLFDDADYQPTEGVIAIDRYLIDYTGVPPCIPVLGTIGE